MGPPHGQFAFQSTLLLMYLSCLRYGWESGGRHGGWFGDENAEQQERKIACSSSVGWRRPRQPGIRQRCERAAAVFGATVLGAAAAVLGAPVLGAPPGSGARDALRTVLAESPDDGCEASSIVSGQTELDLTEPLSIMPPALEILHYGTRD